MSEQGTGEELLFTNAPPFSLALALVEAHKARLLGLDAFAEERSADYETLALEVPEGLREALSATLSQALLELASDLSSTCSFDFALALISAYERAELEGGVRGRQGLVYGVPSAADVVEEFELD